MTNLQREIRNARPRLRLVSPLVHWVILVMGIFNILLGISLYLAFDAARVSAPLLIVNDLFTYRFWGIVFVALGILKLYSLWANNWNLAKNSLLVGISVKAAWAIALTIRSLTSPGTLLINFIWLALAAIQVGTYIFFMPPNVPLAESQMREDRDAD